MPLGVEHDVPVVAVAKLEDVAHEGVACETLDEFLDGCLLLVVEDLEEDASEMTFWGVLFLQRVNTDGIWQKLYKK